MVVELVDQVEVVVEEIFDLILYSGEEEREIKNSVVALCNDNMRCTTRISATSIYIQLFFF